MYLNISAAGWYLIGASIFFIILFGLFVLFYVRVKQKQNDMILKEQAVKYEYEQNLLRTQLEIQEQTLKNISQEIHDNIGQMLSLAKLNLATANIEQKEPLQQKITDSHQLVSKAIQDLRDLSRSMNTDYVSQMGLLRAIEYEIEMTRKAGTINTQIAVTGHPYKLDPQKELIIFRIFQETLNNIIKHSKAQMISVDINYDTTGIILKIADDGEGFDLSPLNENTNSTFGLGIRNMHNRAKLIGADFKVSSTIGKGTEVIIHSPNEKNANDNPSK